MNEDPKNPGQTDQPKPGQTQPRPGDQPKPAGDDDR